MTSKYGDGKISVVAAVMAAGPIDHLSPIPDYVSNGVIYTQYGMDILTSVVRCQDPNLLHLKNGDRIIERIYIGSDSPLPTLPTDGRQWVVIVAGPKDGKDAWHSQESRDRIESQTTSD